VNTYYWQANSVAMPFFSDSSSGFVEAETPMEALKKEVKRYGEKHLYAMTISSCEPKPKLLARYLSVKAIATSKASKLTESTILKEGDKIRIRKEGKDVWFKISELAIEPIWEVVE